MAVKGEIIHRTERSTNVLFGSNLWANRFNFGARLKLPKIVYGLQKFEQHPEAVTTCQNYICSCEETR